MDLDAEEGQKLPGAEGAGRVEVGVVGAPPGHHLLVVNQEVAALAPRTAGEQHLDRGEEESQEDWGGSRLAGGGIWPRPTSAPRAWEGTAAWRLLGGQPQRTIRPLKDLRPGRRSPAAGTHLDRRVRRPRKPVAGLAEVEAVQGRVREVVLAAQRYRALRRRGGHG